MKNNIIYVICALIIAGGMIAGASSVSDVIMQKTFDTSISYPSSYDSYEIMEIDSLMDYLGIYPRIKYDEETIYWSSEQNYGSEIDEQIGSYVDPYQMEMDRLRTELLDNITSEEWVDFPYVKINDTYYFHKGAVNDWFEEKGKEQLEIN